jgi:uncharacterized DUF497 family protein
MQFIFDKNKSGINKTKHGIDFVEAQKLWLDEFRVIIPAKIVGEPRYLIIAKISDKHWSAIFTIRQNKIRIISVRRSRENEKEIYNS